MFKRALLTDSELKIYAEKLTGLTDKELEEEAEEMIFKAGFYSKHSPEDQKCEYIYKECVSRDNEAIYTRGYNKAENMIGVN